MNERTESKPPAWWVPHVLGAGLTVAVGLGSCAVGRSINQGERIVALETVSPILRKELDTINAKLDVILSKK